MHPCPFKPSCSFSLLQPESHAGRPYHLLQSCCQDRRPRLPRGVRTRGGCSWGSKNAAEMALLNTPSPREAHRDPPLMTIPSAFAAIPSPVPYPRFHLERTHRWQCRSCSRTVEGWRQNVKRPLRCRGYPGQVGNSMTGEDRSQPPHQSCPWTGGASCLAN